MFQVQSKEQFDNFLAPKKDLALVAFYKETSQQSMELLEVLKDFEKTIDGIAIYTVNVANVKDIHTVYEINAVPSVLVLKDGKKVNVIVGLQTKEFYEDLVAEEITKSKGDGKKVFRVVVYTSDGCPWCTRAKSYLRELKVPFTEVNVSRKPSEADKLVKRTGQMGTPQIDINGTFVIGFDKPKIDKLLGINGAERRLQ